MLVKLVCQLSQLLGGFAQPFGRLLPHLWHNFVIEISDGALYFGFNLPRGVAKLFVHGSSVRRARGHGKKEVLMQ